MSETEKEKNIRYIVQMLNGLNYYDARDILQKVDERIRGALKIILAEDE